MREAVSREVAIEECDPATFRALLEYLYTDDLTRLDGSLKVLSRHLRFPPPFPPLFLSFFFLCLPSACTAR